MPTTQTASGLGIEEITVGEGAPATAGKRVTVHYTGWLYDPAQSDEANALEGEFREEAEPDYTLTATLYSDWRSSGISTYAWQHDGETVNFRIDHHPNIAGEYVAFEGRLKIKAPNVGGDARTTEMSEISWVIIGKPTFLDNTETESN